MPVRYSPYSMVSGSIAQNITGNKAPINRRSGNQQSEVGVFVIPRCIDQYPCAHWRIPMDMMRQG